MNLTYRELYRMLDEVIAACEAREDSNYVGIRFEDLERNVGDICDCSRHNPDREDERDFPEYGTDGYDDLPILPGTCAYLIYDPGVLHNSPASDIYALRLPRWKDIDSVFSALPDHAYIISGERTYVNDGADDGEVVIEDPVVVRVLY